MSSFSGTKGFSLPLLRMAAVLWFVLFSLWGCAVTSGSTPRYTERLRLSWTPGMSWSVRMRIWPDRLNNPHRRGGPGRENVWQYRVLRRDSSDDHRTVRMQTERERFLLLFGRWHNLLEVRRQLRLERKGVWKTQLLQDNQTGGRVFFSPSGSSPPPALWFHPNMAGTVVNVTRRFNFLTSGQPTGDWVHQRVEQGPDGFRFVLTHRPSTTRITIDWPSGRPWWKRLEWYHQQRLVGVAQTQYETPETDRLPAIRATK